MQVPGGIHTTRTATQTTLVQESVPEDITKQTVREQAEMNRTTTQIMQQVGMKTTTSTITQTIPTQETGKVNRTTI